MEYSVRLMHNISTTLFLLLHELILRHEVFTNINEENFALVRVAHIVVIRFNSYFSWFQANYCAFLKYFGWHFLIVAITLTS